MITKPIVLCDLDGVVVQLAEEWLRLYEQFGGEHIDPASIHYQNLERVVRNPKLLFKCIDKAHALRTAKPYPGAVVGLLRFAQYADIKLLTYARPESYGVAHEAKLAWVWEHLPWFDPNDVMFVHSSNKHLVDGDILIEDNLNTVREWKKHHVHGVGILIDRPWNQDNKYKRRVPDLLKAYYEIMNCEAT